MILIINDNFDLLYFYSFYVAHASIGTALIDFMSLNQRRRNKSVLSVSHVLIWCQCAVRPNPHTQFLIPAKNKSNKTIKKRNAQFVSKSIARKTNFYWLEKTVGLCRLERAFRNRRDFFNAFFMLWRGERNGRNVRWLIPTSTTEQRALQSHPKTYRKREFNIRKAMSI